MTPEQEALFRQYRGLARAAAGAACRRYPAWRSRWDELHNAALVGVWQACVAYDPARSSDPRAWIATRARGAAIDWIRHTGQDARCKAKAPPVVSLDALDYEPCPDRPRDHDAAELLDELLDGLHPSRLRLVRALLAGREQQQYAAEIGVGPSRVSQLYADVLRHARRRAARLGLLPASN